MDETNKLEQLEQSRDLWKYFALVLLGLLVLVGVMRYAPPSHERQSPFIAEPE